MQIYRSIRGGFAPRDAVSALRGIAAREETVCRAAGAIPLSASEQKRVWWVPIHQTQKFKQAIDDLVAEYHRVRDDRLLRPYPELRAEKEQSWMEAAEAGYENLKALGKNGHDRQAYLQANHVLFDSRFPSPADIARKVVAYSEALQDELPPEVEVAFQELRQLESEKLRTEQAALEQQTRLQGIELDLREKEARRLEEEQAARNRLLRESMAREIQQAQGIVLQIRLKLSELAIEIVQAIQENKTVSGPLRRSWRKRIEQLNALAPGNPRMEAALRSLAKVSEQTGRAGEAPAEKDIARAEEQVDQAITYLRQYAGLAVTADNLWALVKAGRAETALREVRAVKEKIERGLEEVGVLEIMLTQREEE